MPYRASKREYAEMFILMVFGVSKTSGIKVIKNGIQVVLKSARGKTPRPFKHHTTFFITFIQLHTTFVLCMFEASNTTFLQLLYHLFLRPRISLFYHFGSPSPVGHTGNIIAANIVVLYTALK